MLDEKDVGLKNRKDLVSKFYKLMDYLESINEEPMSKFEQDALGSMILSGEVTLSNIQNYGINPNELINQ